MTRRQAAWLVGCELVSVIPVKASTPAIDDGNGGFEPPNAPSSGKSVFRRLILLAIVAFLFHFGSQSTFAQYVLDAAASARLFDEGGDIETDEDETLLGPYNFPEDLTASASASVNGASGSASANRNIARASSSASEVVIDDVPRGTRAISNGGFFDTIQVLSLGGPVTGENFALSGKVRYTITRSGDIDSLFGDVNWAFRNIGESNASVSGSAIFSGEQELTIPFGGIDSEDGSIINPKAKLEIGWGAEASSSVGLNSDGGSIDASIELVQFGGIFGLFGGDAFKLGTISNVDQEFHEDMEQFGFVARIVGTSGRVYKRGDKNAIILSLAKENLLEDLKDSLSGGAGTVSTVQGDSSKPFVQMQAGSEVFIYQFVDTPDVPMNFSYDVALPPNSEMENLGTLNVYLNSILIDTLVNADFGLGQFFERSVFLNDPALLGLTDAELMFHWDGPTGELVWLDNAVLTAVPEPATWALALVGCVLVSLGFKAQV